MSKQIVGISNASLAISRLIHDVKFHSVWFREILKNSLEATIEYLNNNLNFKTPARIKVRGLPLYDILYTSKNKLIEYTQPKLSILNYGGMSATELRKAVELFSSGEEKVQDHLKNFGFVDETTVVATGINGKMSEINAAFGLLQLQHIDTAIAKRSEVDVHYRQALANTQGITIPDLLDYEGHNFSYFPILIEKEYPLSRDELYQHLKEKGVMARRYFYPLISDFPMYRGLPSSKASNLAVAREIADKVLCLPIYPDLERGDQDRIIAEIILS
jgi:hypothetical protein